MSQQVSSTVRVLRFADDGRIPNNPDLPLLLYPSALDLAGADDPAAVAERLFASHAWLGAWRNGIFPFPHFHSIAHEVLAVCRGEARVRFGGEQGETVTVHAGDVVVIPAGVGHQNLGSSAGFLVVGAYPDGMEWDLCRGEPGERPRVIDNIAAVPVPPTDPVHGARGPLIEHWAGSDGRA